MGLGKPMTQMGDELRARATSAPQVILSADEARALAQSFDHQHALISQLAATAAQMTTALKLARTFALSSIEMPGAQEVRKYLAAYIDDGRFLPLRWPGDIPELSQALSNMGFINVKGVAIKPSNDANA